MERVRESMRPSQDALVRARLLLASGDIAKAEAEARSAVSLSPAGPDGTVYNTAAVELLGDVCLRKGDNREALSCYTTAARTSGSSLLRPKRVVAYCRLGDYAHARALYRDLPHIASSLSSPDVDLPGIGDKRSLEARALLFLGMELGAETKDKEALECYLAAERLAPTSPLVAYRAAETLSRLGRGMENLARYRLVASKGHGRIAETAARNAAQIEWVAAHLKPAPDATAPAAQSK
jgi:tetratricopeptide (TPR) repeat protein